MADADQDLGHHRQLDIHAVEDAHELGQHVSHEEKHDADAGYGDERRVNQGRTELRLHLGEALEMVGHAPQHLDQRAAGFARPHHVNVKVGKNPGLLGHRVGQAAPFHDILPQFAADIGRDALGLQVRHAVERHGQRHARLEKVGQLLGERRQFLELGLALLRHRRPQGRRHQGAHVAAAAGSRVAQRRQRHRPGEHPPPPERGRGVQSASGLPNGLRPPAPLPPPRRFGDGLYMQIVA